MLKVMTIQDAVRTLRKNTKESQQQFATRLRLATRSIQLHEYGRPADVNALLSYYLEACEQGKLEIQQTLVDAVLEMFPPLPDGWNWYWGLKWKGKRAADGTALPTLRTRLTPPPAAPLTNKRGVK
jgi:hypothetical protein